MYYSVNQNNRQKWQAVLKEIQVSGLPSFALLVPVLVLTHIQRSLAQYRIQYSSKSENESYLI